MSGDYLDATLPEETSDPGAVPSGEPAFTASPLPGEPTASPEPTPVVTDTPQTAAPTPEPTPEPTPAPTPEPIPPPTPEPIPPATPEPTPTPVAPTDSQQPASLEPTASDATLIPTP